MKVCLLTRFFDYRNAGLGRVAIEIRDGLLRRGIEPKCKSASGSSLVSYFLYTSTLIPPRGCDVYHALSPMEALHMPKDRSVVTFNDLILLTNPEMMGSGAHGGLKGRISREYFRFACKVARKANALVCISEKTKSDVIDCLGVEINKVKVIRLGIPGDLTPLSKKSEKFRVGYLGQLDRRKRVGLLIQKFRKFNHNRDIELVIGGIGKDEMELKAMAGGDSRIKFLGLVPEGELCTFYNSLDVFIFPTMIEGYGLPIVEAMACKKPVLVMEDAIIPKEVKDRCVIVEKLEYIFGNQAYLEGVCRYVDYEGNYKWAKEHSWDECIEGYIKTYEEVAA